MPAAPSWRPRDAGHHSPARRILEEVSRQLGNTVAVCRKSYVHPAILALAEDRAHAVKPPPALDEPAGVATRELRSAERRLLRFLDQLADAAAAPPPRS